MSKPHGTVKDGWLIKRDRQVQKFWKYNGYSMNVTDLEGIKGVILHTQYDGVLYASSEELLSLGQSNTFKDEQQVVLDVSLWHRRGI